MVNEIIVFENGEISLNVPVSLEKDTVWLTANQMAILFEKDEKTIRKHINNVFTDEEINKDNNTQKMRVVGVKQKVPFYTLDVIISVGYRVKSKRGVEFRRWANTVLKDYILKGYAVNDNRINQLNEVIRIMKRTDNHLDAKQVLDVIERYTVALDLLDDYDHQRIIKPKGNASIYILSYEECKNVISTMKFNSDSVLFGNEKDESFKSSIGSIYQTFVGVDVYPSVEEKQLIYYISLQRTIHFLMEINV